MNRTINLMAAGLVVVIGFGAASIDARAQSLNVGFLGTGERADPGIIAYLEGQGHTVTPLSPSSGDPAATQALADASDVVLISESIGSSAVSNGGVFHLRDHPVRIVSWEPFMYDEAGWTGTTTHTDFGNTNRPEAPPGLQGPQTDIYIVDAAHPLAGGLGPGAVTVYNNGHAVNFGVPSSHADVVATADSAGDWPTIFTYEAGDQLADGSITPGPRVGFFMGQGGDFDVSLYTADGLTLLSAAVVPAVIPEPSTFLLAALGLLGLLGFARRRRR